MATKQQSPSYLIDTTCAIKSPGPGLEDISHAMVERINAMQELEQSPELKGMKVSYAVKGGKGTAAIVLQGQSEENFKVGERLFEQGTG